LQDEIGRIWDRDRKTVVLITNDVDEGILLADRIIPLSAGPNATLGKPIQVDIERPRDRKALNHDPAFQEIRREVLEFLLGEGSHKPSSTITRRLVLPDIEPEDLSIAPRWYAPTRAPRRRSEIREETLEVQE
jgi:nitrate/nitrite transport system ATP-binding protein